MRLLLAKRKQQLRCEQQRWYLARLIRPAGIKVTRLAHDFLVGSDIVEYADDNYIA